MPVATDIVFLTALALEYDAVLAHLTAVSSHVDPGGTHYTVADLGRGGPRVALAQLGEGNLGAAVLTARAIQEFRPKALILVGVAGGLTDDADIGDVVVATRTHTYQGGREESETFRPRVRSWPVAHGLEQAAREVAQSTVPKVHFKPIVSGDIVLDSRTSPLARLIATHYGDAIAIDMESAGVAEAAHRHSFHRAITVRGISDAADGTKGHSDARGSQQLAAAHAAAFAADLARRIAAGTDPPAGPQPTTITTGGPPPATVRPRVRRAHLLSAAALVAAVSLLVHAGATTLRGDRTEVGATPSNQDTPAATTQFPGWVELHRGRDVRLDIDHELDMDTGAITVVEQVATGPDLKLAREADRMITHPHRVQVLEATGPESPERCASAGAERWDGSIDGLWLLTPGRNICVAMGDGRSAMLTIVRPPNGTDHTLTFHYALWKRQR